MPHQLRRNSLPLKLRYHIQTKNTLINTIYFMQRTIRKHLIPNRPLIRSTAIDKSNHPLTTHRHKKTLWKRRDPLPKRLPRSRLRRRKADRLHLRHRIQILYTNRSDQNLHHISPHLIFTKYFFQPQRFETSPSSHHYQPSAYGASASPLTILAQAKTSPGGTHREDCFNLQGFRST